MHAAVFLGVICIAVAVADTGGVNSPARFLLLLSLVLPCYWLLMFVLVAGKRGMVELRAQADALARQDPLTGLANRRALLEAISAASGMVGLLTLDVDDFKGINTLYGHPGGDRALVFVADALRTSSREQD